VIRLEVRGKPQALKRHRTFRLPNGNIRNYDPSEGDKKDFLAICQNKAPKSPLDGPISMKLWFYMPRPKNHYGTGRNAGILKDWAPRLHTSKPDLDNLVKFVKDALNKVFYLDDSQISTLAAGKFYASVPRTIIEIGKI